MKMTLGEIAALVSGRLEGNASLTVEGAANLENARETDVTFAVEPHIQEAKAQYLQQYITEGAIRKR